MLSSPWYCLVQWCQLDMKNYTLVYFRMLPHLYFSFVAGAWFDGIIETICVTVVFSPLLRPLGIALCGLTRFFITLPFVFSFLLGASCDGIIGSRCVTVLSLCLFPPWCCLVRRTVPLSVYTIVRFVFFFFSVRCLMRWDHWVEMLVPSAHLVQEVIFIYIYLERETERERKRKEGGARERERERERERNVCIYIHMYICTFIHVFMHIHVCVYIR